ncbi:Utilization protein for unknown catechol-siderophore X [Pacificimonas flava]|uniref:FAD-binding FR-type domain-containing protein n=3 Tax=Pacificimonas flava TaxID=1234595 RepID=M2SBH4_9SPHN|nr:Utilization protein for unknown catechol-siderophore X [Pacificimonas flava]
MMKRPEPRRLTVLETTRVTPNMHRVLLGGPGLTGFPPEQDGGYVKLRIPGEKTCVRTYTIRRQTEEALTLDFALHGEGAAAGPATSWALTAAPGDELEVGGPGPAKPLPPGRGPFLLCGDMTALPAISVNLEALSEDAVGRAVIEVQSEDDRQDIAAPSGMAIEWLINPSPGARPEVLDAAVRGAVRAAGGGDGTAYAWAACEFDAMRRLRQYLRAECGLGPDRLYISSYWKRGLIEDEHKVAKRTDAETDVVSA